MCNSSFGASPTISIMLMMSDLFRSRLCGIRCIASEPATAPQGTVRTLMTSFAPYTDGSRRLLRLVRSRSITFPSSHALTQQYGRRVNNCASHIILLHMWHRTCGLRKRVRRHTTPPTVRPGDEVNSEHGSSKVPRPAGRCRGRPRCSTCANESGGGLLDTARRPTLSRRLVQGDIRGHLPVRFAMQSMPAYLLFSPAGVGGHSTDTACPGAGTARGARVCSVAHFV